MNVFIRADASTIMGIGHVMRCLTLADKLRESGAVVSFICRNFPGNMCSAIEDNGYKVYTLPASDMIVTTEDISTWLGADWLQDAREVQTILVSQPSTVDLLVVDHYAIDKRWEEMMAHLVQKVMVIDDLANRPHNCNVLVDQNLYPNMDKRYSGLISKACLGLFGPSYALLRPEFIRARAKHKVRDGIVRRILLFFGGSDPTNETFKALDAIKLLNRPELIFDVVVGASNKNRDEIKQLCLTMHNVNYYCQVNNMAEIISNADLAIGAGGTATWERCCLGLPALIIAVAHNQVLLSKTIGKAGAGIYLGEPHTITPISLKIQLEQLIAQPDTLIKVSRIASQLVDGEGSLRIIRCLKSLL